MKTGRKKEKGKKERITLVNDKGRKKKERKRLGEDKGKRKEKSNEKRMQ